MEKKSVELGGDAHVADRFRFIEYFENLPLLAYSVGLDGRIIYCNKAVLKTLGYRSKKELIGKSLQTTIYAPSSLEKAKKLFQKWKKTGRLENEELQVITKKGKAKDVLLNTDTIYDENGKPLYSVSTQLDVSKRKQVEEALRESEENLSLIYETTGDVLFQIGVEPNDSYRFLSVNNAFLTATGLTEDQIVGKTIDEVIPEPSLALVRGNYQKAIREKKTVHWEETSEYPTGVKVGYVNVTPAFDEKGKCTHLIGSVQDITERLRVEDELKKETYLSQLFLDSMPCIALLLKRGTREIVASNKEAKEIGAIPGKKCYEVWGPSDKPHPFCEAPKLWKTEKRQRKIVEAYGVIWDANWVPVNNETYLHYAFDITESKKAEDRLLASEEKFRELVGSSKDAIITTGEKDEILLFNKAAEEMFGFKADEVIGKTQEIFIPPEYRERHAKGIKRFLKTGKGQLMGKTIELEALRKNKERFPIELTLFKFETMERRFVTAIIRNITERKKVEEELADISKKNELILEAAGEGIYGLDLEGKTTFVNPAAAKMIDWDVEDIIGKSQHDLLHHTKPDGEPYPREECPIYAAFKDGEVHHVSDEVFWRKDGSSFPVEYISTPIRDEHNKLSGAVVTFMDITERKKAEDALRSS
ncbi:MAG: PAS domain-containing protein, partial [Candidatus Hydrothermarchaeales archaeon]